MGWCDRDVLANWFADESGPFTLLVNTGQSPMDAGYKAADALLASGIISRKPTTEEIAQAVFKIEENCKGNATTLAYGVARAVLSAGEG